MSIPITVRAGAAGAYLVNATPSGDVLVTAPQHAVLSPAEAEELADTLRLIAHASRPGRAKPITSVDDPRVRGE